MRGLPPAKIARYLPGVLAVTSGGGQAAAAELLARKAPPSSVGEASQFLERCGAYHANCDGDPIAELNLERAGLR